MKVINYSIIIPHKNIPELLARCIESIPQRDDIQIIVVDDNSDDADTFLKKYPELFRTDIEFHFTKEGKGASYARNVGMEHIKGKWVLFADADDVFLPGWTNIIDQYLDSSADVIHFKITHDTRRNDLMCHNGLIEEYVSGKKTAREILFSNITCWAKMFSALFLKENNIQFEEVKYGTDVAFGYEIAVKANTIEVSQSAIYMVSYREGSLTTFKDREAMQIRYETVKRANAYAADNGFKRYELPHAIEVLKTWRKLGLRDFFYFIRHERHEIRKASKVQIDKKPFNYRHPYLYVLLVLLRLV